MHYSTTRWPAPVAPSSSSNLFPPAQFPPPFLPPLLPHLAPFPSSSRGSRAQVVCTQAPPIMAAPLWLQLPAPPLHNPLFLSSNHSSSATPLLCRKHAPTRRNLLCSSSVVASSSNSSSVVTKEQEGAAEAVPAPPAGEGSEPALVSYRDDPNFRGCTGCGRDELEKDCNGEGRIQGGIATVPGFGWWPIKAYRPCPSFVASGGRYRRQGQSMDDVVSGREKKVSSNKKKSDK